MKRSLIAALAAASVVVLALPASAAAPLLTNGGFEAGLAGWDYTQGNIDFSDGTTAPYVDVTTLATAATGEDFAAKEGGQFAILIANDQPEGSTLSQTFSLNEGERVTGYAAFLGFDYDPYFDAGSVTLTKVGTITPLVLFSASIGTGENQPHTPWITFNSGALSAGDYILQASVVNSGDPDPTYSSRLLLDGVAVSVPEPQSWALMILGFAGLGAALRARRKVGPQRA